MARFTIGILHRDRNIHMRCFEDFAEALADALKQLGHELTDFKSPGRLILFGVNNSTSEATLPPDTIVFNTEQMTSFGGDVRKQMINFDFWRKFYIWDYSDLNAQKLRDAGAERVVHCPLGYTASMTKFKPVREQGIDLLFYGAVNPRRRIILDDLTRAGVCAHHLYGAYGAERDAVIARSKIVLNLHFYDESVFEIFRVSHLLANSVCVVSEDGAQDVLLETFARKVTCYTPRNGIVQACRKLLANDAKRQAVAHAGFMAFSKLSLVDHVRTALEQS